MSICMRPTWKPLAEPWPGAAAIPKRIRTARREILKNLQENPTARDIENGNALERRAHPAQRPEDFQFRLEARDGPVEASVIREIPFRNASEAVTIVLSQVKAVTKWPAVLGG